MRQGRAGFTLLELLTVISVVGFMAAYAVPSYLRWTYEGKQVQAEMLVRSIAHRVRVAQEEGRAVESCGPTPREIPKKQPAPFPITACWTALGFAPRFFVHYQLQLRVDPNGGFVVTATGDLDDDGTPQVVSIDGASPFTTRRRGVY